MGGDLSAVIDSASRRPRTSMCLVKAGSRPVQIATPAFLPPPVCHDSIPGHQVSYQRFWENRWIPDSLPTGQRPRRKPPLVDSDRHPAMSGPRPHINKKRHSSSMSFFESHRRRPSNPHRTLTERLMSLSASAPKALKLSVGPRPNNSLRSYKLIRSGDFRLFPPANFANSAILPTDKISTFFMQNFLPQKPKDSSWSMPLLSPQGKNDRLRYRSAERTVSTP